MVAGRAEDRNQRPATTRNLRHQRRRQAPATRQQRDQQPASGARPSVLATGSAQDHPIPQERHRALAHERPGEASNSRARALRAVERESGGSSNFRSSVRYAFQPRAVTLLTRGHSAHTPRLERWNAHVVHTPGAHPRRHPRRTNLHDLLSAALTVPRRAVDNKFVTRRQRWALPGLIVLPFVSSVGCVVLFGPVLVGMAPVFAALTALGALLIVATAVHQWTRSVALAVLATGASVLVSVFGLFSLMLWAASGAQFG